MQRQSRFANGFSCALTALVLVFLLCVPMLAQTKSATAKKAAPAELSVEDVIKLSKAGLSEDIIIQHIRKKAHAFDLTTDQLIALKNANVSDRVVQVMMDPSKPDVPATPAAATASTTTNPKTAASIPFGNPTTAEPDLPTEIGVYVKKEGKWAEVAPEVAYFKSGGAFKTVVSVGIARGDGGKVMGLTARNVYAMPLEFLVVMAEGSALPEYQLLRLTKDLDNRNFRGGTRDVIPFEPKKLSTRAISFIFPSTAGAGEYGILPPSAGKTGKIFTFRID